MRSLLVACLCGCIPYADEVPVDDTAPWRLDCDPLTAEVPCGAFVTPSPEDGAVDVFYRRPLRVTVPADGRLEGDWLLRDESEDDLPGSIAWSADGLEGVILPLDGWTPGGTVTWTLVRDCCRDEEGSFTVGTTGPPVMPNAVEGSMFLVRPFAGRAVEGGAVVAALATAQALVRFDAWSGNTTSYELDLAGARDVGGVAEVDRCAPLLRADALYDADPWFESAFPGPVTWFDGRELRWRAFALSGAFRARAEGIDGVRVQGTIEAGSVAAALSLADADAVCAEEACVPCGEERCVAIDVQDGIGTEWTGTFVPVSVVEAEANRAAGTCVP